MFHKTRIIIVAVVSVLIIVGLTFVVWGDNPSTTANQNTGKSSPVPSVQKTFTKTELKQFDGQNGHPAYIAVNGMVYDVTNVAAWKGGKHKGYKAGQDLTEAIKNSPHSVKVLAGLPVVGKYIDK